MFCTSISSTKPSALADEIVDLMDVLDLQTFDVIGFSWGTLPELALVARYPARIRRAGFLGADAAARVPRARRRSAPETRRPPVAELDALAPGSPLRDHLAHCMAECRRTGSRFFTDGWRMFLDPPRHALGDLARAAAHVDLRLYVGEHDNVHLPRFAEMIASAFCATEVAARPVEPAANDVRGFVRVCSSGRCSISVAPGAGRMACMLYVEEDE